MRSPKCFEREIQPLVSKNELSQVIRGAFGGAYPPIGGNEGATDGRIDGKATTRCDWLCGMGGGAHAAAGLGSELTGGGG